MPRSAHRRSAELAVAPGAPLAGEGCGLLAQEPAQGKTANAGGTTTGATVWITRLSVSSRLQWPKGPGRSQGPRRRPLQERPLGCAAQAPSVPAGAALSLPETLSCDAQHSTHCSCQSRLNSGTTNAIAIPASAGNARSQIHQEHSCAWRSFTPTPRHRRSRCNRIRKPRYNDHVSSARLDRRTQVRPGSTSDRADPRVFHRHTKRRCRPPPS